MIDEHSREDELYVKIIGLQGIIDKLKREKKEIILDIVKDLKGEESFYQLITKWKEFL